MRMITARIRYYLGLLFNRQTPWYVRLLLGLGLIYLIIPMDFIPDYVPVLGLVDDVTIGAMLISLAIRLLPKQV